MIPPNLSVGEARVNIQGRILAVFEISNRFWAHEDLCSTFDRSTKDIILILFNVITVRWT